MSSLLPPAAYYSSEWWDLEQERLFGRTYNLVAYEADLPNPGDRVIAEVAGHVIILTRDADGEISAATRSAAPSAPLSVGRWAGLVFVCPGTDPPSFSTWLGTAAVPANAGDYPWDDLVEIDRIGVPLKCNWKLYIENHVDIYHLWYLHDESLGMYDHPNLTWWSDGPHWGCVEAVRPGLERARPGMLAITPIPDAERPLLRANLIFPNVPLTTMQTSVMTYQVIPTGPETCRLDLRIRGQRGSQVEDRMAFLRVQRDEDGTACEAIQTAIRSPAFGVGPLAQDYERPITAFHEAVLAAVER